MSETNVREPLEPGFCHVCEKQVGSRLCTDGKQRIPLHLKYQQITEPERPHAEHRADRCCGEHGHHVTPHRGCVLR